VTLIDLQGNPVDPYAPLGFCSQCNAAAWTTTAVGLLCPDHAGVLEDMQSESAAAQVRTAGEVQELCRNWRNDPCWDLETTEGFEAHAPELLEYRQEWERKWAADQHAIVMEKAFELGVPGNTALATYVMRMEREIATLKDALLNGY
jgi:hypothetical protein